MVTYPVETNQNNGLQFGKCKTIFKNLQTKKMNYLNKYMNQNYPKYLL